jgi:hypothetical protein
LGNRRLADVQDLGSFGDVQKRSNTLENSQLMERHNASSEKPEVKGRRSNYLLFTSRDKESQWLAFKESIGHSDARAGILCHRCGFLYRC